MLVKVPVYILTLATNCRALVHNIQSVNNIDNNLFSAMSGFITETTKAHYNFFFFGVI